MILTITEWLFSSGHDMITTCHFGSDYLGLLPWQLIEQSNTEVAKTIEVTMVMELLTPWRGRVAGRLPDIAAAGILSCPACLQRGLGEARLYGKEKR